MSDRDFTPRDTGRKTPTTALRRPTRAVQIGRAHV
jgi:hypothetical protein